MTIARCEHSGIEFETTDDYKKGILQGLKCLLTVLETLKWIHNTENNEVVKNNELIEKAIKEITYL